MTIFIIIIRIISLVLISSVLICGLYLSVNKEKVPDYQSSVKFHKYLGLGTLVVSAVTILI